MRAARALLGIDQRTLAELAGAKTPDNTDGLSFVPTLLGQQGQKQHDYLYWEFPEKAGSQAVRIGADRGLLRDAAYAGMCA